MRSKEDLHTYQQDAITYLYEHDHALALMPVGAGKTVVTMTALQELMLDKIVERPLVFAPLRVASLVWPYEGDEWAHLKGTPIVCWGGEPSSWPDSIWKQSRILWGQRVNAEQRLPKIVDVRKRRVLEDRLAEIVREERLVNKEARRAELPKAIHVTSYENLLWICELWPPGESPFDAWVFDELGKLKNPKSPRYKAVRKHTAEVKIVFGLNATPAPEGFFDLFSQVQVVDGPRLWGKSVYAWRQRYFVPTDYMGFQWRLQIGAQDLLMQDLNSIAFKVDETQLSYQRSMQHNQIVIELPPKARAAYNEMEKHMALAIEGRDDIVAMSAAAASMKLRQITSGFIYDKTGHAEILHQEKQHALADLIDDMGREPLLVAYEFAEDLEAIRRVWKNVSYLGQGVSAATAKETVDKWNRRQLPVLALHPFCLHPATLVLTEEAGWKKLIDVRADERVFDGTEFVSHRGCQLSGIRPVIDCLGITMTPDHLVLVNDEWKKAEDVRDSGDLSRAARYAYQGDDPRIGAMLRLRGHAGSAQAERRPLQPVEEKRLRPVRVPSDDRHPALAHMEGYTGSSLHPRNQGFQTLRRAWNRGRPRLAELQEFLARYAGWLRGRFDDRTDGRERQLLQGELPLGYEYGAAGQQAEQSNRRVQRRADALLRVLPCGGSDEGRDSLLSQPVQDRRRGDEMVPEIDLPALSGQSSGLQVPQKVYDLVDCGPRHRFVVRNAEGEMFIVHNSAGHGLNLQAGGSHIAWYSIPWPLESWIQTNGRIDRQGQTRACYGHSIVAKNSMDDRVWGALTAKDAEQSKIIAAIRRI